MNLPPTEPQAHDRLSATWLRDLVRFVRSIRPIAGSGVRMSVGPNGTVISATAVGTSAGARPDLGCYRIESDEREGSTVHKFGNPYVTLGDVLAEHPVDTVLEDLLEEAGSDADEDSSEPAEDGVEHLKLFLALRILARPARDDDGDDQEDQVRGYKTLGDLVEDQRDREYHTIPLYLLDVTKTTEDGETSYSYGIACDFRRGVYGQQMEVFE